MRIALIAAAALTVTGCGAAGTVDGRLVDGLTDTPLTEGRLLLKSSDTTDMTCMTIEGILNPDGTFNVTGTCSGATYHLELPKEMEHLQIDTTQSIAGGEPVSLGDMAAWNAPGAGVYHLSDNEAKMMRTGADLDSVTIWETDVEVNYPKKLPGRIPVIEAGHHLLIAGKANVDKLKFHPLVKSEEKLRFGEPDHYFDMEPWYYIGVTFESKTEYEMVTVTVDQSAIIKANVGDFEALYLTEKALPPGRYALLGDDDKRTYIVDFGVAPAAKKKDAKEEG